MEGGLDARLTISWDREGDILHLDAVWPHSGPLEAEFLADDIVAFFNTDTRALEGLEILGFSRRFRSLGDTLELPILAEMRLEPALALVLADG